MDKINKISLAVASYENVKRMKPSVEMKPPPLKKKIEMVEHPHLGKNVDIKV